MKQIIQQEQLDARLADLGTEISSQMVKTCQGTEDDLDAVIVVGVLSGGAFLTIDLIRMLSVPAILGWVRVESYRCTTKAVQGNLRVDALFDWNADFSGRRVLVVDDILDTGSTMAAVVHHIAGLGPRSIQTVTLLRKPCKDREVVLDYVGFDIPDQFVVGDGLDHDGLYRDLPGVWVL